MSFNTKTGFDSIEPLPTVMATRTRKPARWLIAVAAAVLPGLMAAEPAAADTAHYRIYVHGYLSDGIAGYNASDTGNPTAIAGRASSGLPNWPEAASRDGRFLYVAPTVNPRLIPYAIGADGALSPAGTPLPLPDIPIDITFAPNGRDAYVIVGLMNGAVVPVRFGGNGVPVHNGPVTPLGTVGDGIASAAVSPDGRNLYVASVPDRQLLVFDIHADGTLSAAKQRVAGGINPLFPTLTPDGRHLFFTNELSGTVQAFNRSADGTLTEVAGSPFKAGIMPHVASITPDGRYLYVPNTGSTFISAYAIEPNGALLSLPNVEFAPDKMGVFTESSVMSPSGRALWVLGTDPLRAGEELLRRFAIGRDGTLMRDESTSIYTGTTVADGRTMTLVPQPG
ncbi:lactonase family protein [Skermania sp. ID1734]|uniref:lactonase family protein n=1 Tax=Skermania sp. ID1734 TaxID=2597516 RepID=UPI00117C5DBA|nr:beta-propeller fold lactonase family protein [Skermania sp. ID1734]TSD94080.1 lactonase family protein [Skermania sp. ID1734]